MNKRIDGIMQGHDTHGAARTDHLSGFTVVEIHSGLFAA